MPASRHSLLPPAVALAVVVVWGATPVATKFAAGEIDPVLVGLLRTILGGVAALALVIVLRTPPPAGTRLRGLLLLSAFCGFIGFPILFTLGQQRTSAMHGGLILAMLPVFTGLYAAAFERRMPGRRWWLGCVLAIAGESVLILSRGGSAGATLAGDMLVLASAMLAALGYVVGARLGQAGYASLGATFWGIIVAAVALAPFLGLSIAGSGLPEAGWPAWAGVVWLAIPSSILGYIGWYWALAAGGIARMATAQFLQPVSGLVLAALLLGERMTLPLALAATMIVAGIVIAQRR